MKKLIAIVRGAKVYASASNIKGYLSGGQRDSNGKDWKKSNGGLS